MQPIPIRRSQRRLEVVAPTVPTRRTRKIGAWWPVLVVALLASAVAGVPALRRWRDPARSVHPTATVTSGAFIGVLPFEGRLQTQSSVRVGAPSAGQVVAVDVVVGDRVKRGERLAQLDDLEQKTALADARASVDSAKIRRVRVEKRLVEELGRLDDEGSSAGDLGADDLLGGAAGNAQLDLMSASLQIQRMSSVRALARDVLAKRTIRAPIDGVVLARAIDPGETITASPPGPPLFVIGSEPANLRLEAEVDDGYAARVRPGPVKLAVVDYPRRSFTANIREVIPASAFLGSVGRYHVVLDVENKSGALRAGMSATFALPMETPPNALRVPLAALVPAPPHVGRRDAVVWSVDGAGARTPVSVELGVVNDRLAEIRAGSLRPGMTIAVAP